MTPRVIPFTMRPLSALLLTASLTSLHAANPPDSSPEVKPFPKALVQSVWVQSIWADGKHNGFPGIARVGDFYYVTFRNSDSHQAPSSAKLS